MENLLKEIFESESLVRLIISNPRKKSLPYRKVSLRPIVLHEKIAYQGEYHFQKKVTQENFTPDQAINLILDYINQDFKQLDIFTTTQDIQVLASKPEKPRIIKKKANRCKGDLTHNKQKKYLIPDGTPCDFLIRLGVMNSEGKVFPKYYSKFRQINRYLEILQDVYNYLPENKNSNQKNSALTNTVKIIDFGCGKAYLTFALYHYLKIVQKRDVEIIGLDLKQDVIDFCSQVAEDLHYDDLRFEMGDIAEYEQAGGTTCDMVVTLHACDTATDFALINAVKWNTKVILSVPCCQHELFNQLDNPVLNPMLKHGIIKDRFTEIITDGLRGLKLESAGYDVSMIEFTSLEHTARNIMIKAIKTKSANAAQSKKAASEYAAMCKEYKVNPTIDQLKTQ